MNKEQFEVLQESVIQHWNIEGKKWSSLDNVGFQSPDPEHYELVVEDWAEEILSSKELCVQELGYNSVAEYMKENYE